MTTELSAHDAAALRDIAGLRDWLQWAMLALTAAVQVYAGLELLASSTDRLSNSREITLRRNGMTERRSLAANEVKHCLVVLQNQAVACFYPERNNARGRLFSELPQKAVPQ